MQANTISLEQPVQKRQKVETANAPPQTPAKANVTVAAPVKQAQKQKTKKKRPMTPELQLIVDIQAAAKTKQPSIGLAAYNKAIADGTQINPDLYSTLLYLCAGGDDWELPLRQQLTETSPLVQEVMKMSQADDHSRQDVGHADPPVLDAAATSATQDSSPTQQQQRQQLPQPQQAPDVKTGASNGAATASAVTGSPTLAALLTEFSASTASDARSPSAAEHKLSSATAPTTAEEEAAIASPPATDLQPMTAAELHSIGRSIFAQMQVSVKGAMHTRWCFHYFLKFACVPEAAICTSVYNLSGVINYGNSYVNSEGPR